MKNFILVVRKTLAGAVPDILYVAGCSSVVYAAWLVSAAASFAIGGVLLLATAWLIGGNRP